MLGFTHEMTQTIHIVKPRIDETFFLGNRSLVFGIWSLAIRLSGRWLERLTYLLRKIFDKNKKSQRKIVERIFNSLVEGKFLIG